MTNETMRNILDAICGPDEHGLPKTSVVCMYELWSTMGSRRISDTRFNSAIVSMVQNAGYVTIDFKFATKNNIDFKMTYELLEDFLHNPIKNDNENADTLPMISFTIVPDELDGESYMVALNPLMWCITADSPDEPELNHLRIVFNENDVVIYEAEDDYMLKGNESEDDEAEDDLKLTADKTE